MQENTHFDAKEAIINAIIVILFFGTIALLSYLQWAEKI